MICYIRKVQVSKRRQATNTPLRETIFSHNTLSLTYFFTLTYWFNFIYLYAGFKKGVHFFILRMSKGPPFP